ncbi:MAG: efflux RND transporter permease subunit [Polyangiaceae bacterium]
MLRPVATVLFMAAILLSGWVAYQQLPVSALPQVDYPTIQVLTFYPGAAPEVMASSVTAPLERQFGQVPGLTQMTSTSSEGCSVITLRFNLELDIDIAGQQVQAAINAATNFLPTRFAESADLYEDQPGGRADSHAGVIVQDIAAVQSGRSCRYAFRPENLAAFRRRARQHQRRSETGRAHPGESDSPCRRWALILDDLRAAIAAANVNQAKGSFDGDRQSFTIGANDQLITSEQYRHLIIAFRGGAPVGCRMSPMSSTTSRTSVKPPG